MFGLCPVLLQPPNNPYYGSLPGITLEQVTEIRPFGQWAHAEYAVSLCSTS